MNKNLPVAMKFLIIHIFQFYNFKYENLKIRNFKKWQKWTLSRRRRQKWVLLFREGSIESAKAKIVFGQHGWGHLNPAAILDLAETGLCHLRNGINGHGCQYYNQCYALNHNLPVADEIFDYSLFPILNIKIWKFEISKVAEMDFVAWETAEMGIVV